MLTYLSLAFGFVGIMSSLCFYAALRIENKNKIKVRYFDDKLILQSKRLGTIVLEENIRAGLCGGLHFYDPYIKDETFISSYCSNYDFTPSDIGLGSIECGEQEIAIVNLDKDETFKEAERKISHFMFN